MSPIDNILDELGLKHYAPGMHRDIGLPPSRPDTGSQPVPPPAPAGPAAQAPVSEVDVVSKLDRLAAARPDRLDWKKSIADLLQLLGMDNSFAARKALAAELGCPADKMGDSYQMNLWLHQAVLKKIAENGGNVPKDLLS